MSIIRTVMVLAFSISALYFLFWTYSSIRRIRSMGFFHHYRLYMPIAGLFISIGSAGFWACPRVWYVSVIVQLAGFLIALRELIWALRASAGRIAAGRLLAAERRRFRQHNEEDRKLLSQLQENLESAGWACKARRFRDAHRSIRRLLDKLKLTRRR